jgi:hypothetical protein
VVYLNPASPSTDSAESTSVSWDSKDSVIILSFFGTLQSNIHKGWSDQRISSLGRISDTMEMGYSEGSSVTSE